MINTSFILSKSECVPGTLYLQSIEILVNILVILLGSTT